MCHRWKFYLEMDEAILVSEETISLSQEAPPAKIRRVNGPGKVYKMTKTCNLLKYVWKSFL